MDIHTRIVAVRHIVFGALGLFSLPWGTLLGIYTLWALLRKQPVPDVVDARSGLARKEQ
jgi:hypothetical protein